MEILKHRFSIQQFRHYGIRIMQNKHFLLLGVNILLGIVLAMTTLYVAIESNYQQTINSDMLIYPYIFHHFSLNNIVLPGHHSNLLMFPLYFIQAILPFNFVTFSAVNIGLTIATISLSVALLTIILGKKYFPVICSMMSLFLIASPSWVNVLTGNSARNIEYPIGLALILGVTWLIKGRMKMWQKAIMISSAILLCLALAGDELMLFSFVIPIGLTIIIYVLKGHKLNKRLASALALIIGIVIFAYLLIFLVQHTGIASYYYASVFKPHTIPINDLGFSFSTAARQLLNLTGANIFGINKLNAGHVINFVNFLLITCGIAGFGVLLKRTILNKKNNNISSSDLILVALALSFFLTFGIYILAGQAVHVASNGQLVSSSQFRYMSFLPILAIAGAIYLFKQVFSRLNLLIVSLSIGAVIVIVLAVPTVRFNEQVLHNQTASARSVINGIVSTSKQNHVSVLLTGYWYEATTHFWSNNTIQTASVKQCNIASPTFNTARSLYKPTKNPKTVISALVVDRSGPDKSYWSYCSPKQITHIFGVPSKVVLLDGINQVNAPVRNSIQFWIYNYDVRSKVLLF